MKYTLSDRFKIMKTNREMPQQLLSSNNSVFQNLEILCDILLAGLKKSLKTTKLKNCMVLEVLTLSMSSAVPAFICACSALLGWDCNLLAIGIMIVYTVYLINEKEKHIVDKQNLTHIALWIRIGILLVAFLISITAHYGLESVTQEFLPLKIALIYFLTLKYLALYRMYVSFFKAVAVTIRQMQSIKIPKSTETSLENKNQ